jgi:ATP-dependent DNA helicase RecG
MDFMNLSNRTKFRNKYIKPLLEENLLAMTIPDKPTSSNQKYYTTRKGLELIKGIKG